MALDRRARMVGSAKPCSVTIALTKSSRYFENGWGIAEGLSLPRNRRNRRAIRAKFIRPYSPDPEGPSLCGSLLQRLAACFTSSGVTPEGDEPEYLDDGDKIASRHANISSPDAPVLKLGKESLTFFH